MLYGPLESSDYRPLFSGHETFPLRTGWLRKAYEAVAADVQLATPRNPFTAEDSIARFGVGKNMVSSMRHWAVATGIIEDATSLGNGVLRPTVFGRWLLDNDTGVDPFLEDSASVWLLHWHLAEGSESRPLKTTWYWLFNIWSGYAFTRDELVAALLDFASRRGWRRVSRTTVTRDIDCLIRCYARTAASTNPEEDLESQLSELRLIDDIHGRYSIARRERNSIPDEVFLYALMAHWRRTTSASTMTLQTATHAPGSPGRIFLLSEEAVATRLQRIADYTGGAIEWSETAGLQQVVQRAPIHEPLHGLETHYRTHQ